MLNKMRTTKTGRSREKVVSRRLCDKMSLVDVEMQAYMFRKEGPYIIKIVCGVVRETE